MTEINKSHHCCPIYTFTSKQEEERVWEEIDPKTLPYHLKIKWYIKDFTYCTSSHGKRV